MIRKGEPWEAAADGAEVTVSGTDADLAAWLSAADDVARVASVRFAADASSDLARSLGLVGLGGAGSEESLSVAVDAMRVMDMGVAVNAVVMGPNPARLRAWHRAVPMVVECDGAEAYRGRATTVVVATGQFVDGHDVIPRAHPGDGWLEVQVYAVPAGERGELRRRVRAGVHLPHPRIVTRRAHSVGVEVARGVPVTIDGRPRGKKAVLSVEVWPSACQLVVGGEPHG